MSYSNHIYIGPCDSGVVLESIIAPMIALTARVDSDLFAIVHYRTRSYKTDSLLAVRLCPSHNEQERIKKSIYESALF